MKLNRSSAGLVCRLLIALGSVFAMRHAQAGQDLSIGNTCADKLVGAALESKPDPAVLFDEPENVILRQLAELRLNVETAKKEHSLALARTLSFAYRSKLEDAHRLKIPLNRLSEFIDADRSMNESDEKKASDDIKNTHAAEQDLLPWVQSLKLPLSEQPHIAKISPDESLVLVCGAHTITVRDAFTGAELYSQNQTQFNNLALFSPDSRVIAVLREKGVVTLMDSRNGTILNSLTAQQDYLKSMAFSPDSKLLATIGHDKKLIIWDLKTGAPKHIIVAHTRELWSMAFNPTGTEIITAGEDSMGMIWRVSDGDRILKIPSFTGVESVEFSSDGQRLLTGAGSRSAKIWDAKTGKILQHLTWHNEGSVIGSAAFDSASRQVVTATNDGSAIIWDAQNGRMRHRLKVPGKNISRATFSPNGKFVLATLSSTFEALIFDSETGELVQSLDDVLMYSNASYSKSGAAILTIGSDKSVSIWRHPK